MSIRRRKFVLRYSSPSTLWFGMLLSCFAWIMHATLLLNPLSVGNAHLGQSIYTTLAPIISVASQYEQIQTDVAQTENNLPDDSAAYHLHHYTAPNCLASSPTPKSTIVTATKAPSKESLSDHNADPDSIKHMSCDLCISMSALLVPEVFVRTDSVLIELPAVLEPFLYHSKNYYPTNFLRPLARAPPQAIAT